MSCDLCDQFQRAIQATAPGAHLYPMLKRLYAEHKAEAHTQTSTTTAPKES